eukprot:8793836-Alexandrium_andersonii.AAC.1
MFNRHMRRTNEHARRPTGDQQADKHMTDKHEFMHAGGVQCTLGCYSFSGGGRTSDRHIPCLLYTSPSPRD